MATSPELSGANCHAKLSNSRQFLKIYISSDVSTFLLTDEQIFTAVTLKNLVCDFILTFVSVRPSVCPSVFYVFYVLGLQ